jgi:Tol biopolymer transport system component
MLLGGAHRVRWAAALLALVISSAPAACGGLGAASFPALPPGISGKLTYNREGNIYILPLDTRVEQQLTSYASTSPALFSARSSDGSRLAVVRKEGIGQILSVMNADRTGSRVILDENSGRTTIAQPQWTPDNQSIIYMLHTYVYDGSLLKSENFRIERIRADGTSRVVITPNALDPTAAPDGALAFMRSTDDSRQLILRSPDGTERVQVPGDGFLNVAAPRFSPDGQRIAFAASGTGPDAAAEPRGWRLPLAPSIAYAHGPPWDIWLAERGGGVRLLARLAEDEPTLAWSPDGRYLAVSGGTGIYVIEGTSGQVFRVAGAGGFGGIDWTP